MSEPSLPTTSTLPAKLEGTSICAYTSGDASGKEPVCPCRRLRRSEFYPWVGKIPWRRAWQPTPVFLPEESCGQRNLVGYSPWGREESDTTERLPFHFSLSCTGEGNGNPLQYSCLENPLVRGTWWAIVHGVAKSLTRISNRAYTYFKI